MAMSAFFGCLLVRNDPITKDVGVELLQILYNHCLPNRFSLAVKPLVSAEKHASPALNARCIGANGVSQVSR